MREDAAPGKTHASHSSETLPPDYLKDCVAVGWQLSTLPWELISHQHDATDTCFEQRAGTPAVFRDTEHLATPLGAEIPSNLGATGPDSQQNWCFMPQQSPSIPTDKPCDPMAPSPWIYTLHRRLAPCSVADGYQSLQLEKRMYVGRGSWASPCPVLACGNCSYFCLQLLVSGQQRGGHFPQVKSQEKCVENSLKLMKANAPGEK